MFASLIGWLVAILTCLPPGFWLPWVRFNP